MCALFFSYDQPQEVASVQEVESIGTATTISASDKPSTAIRNVLDLRAEGKDEAPSHPLRRKTSYKETAAKLLRESLEQGRESAQREEQRHKQQQANENVRMTSKLHPASIPATVIEISESDSETEWTLDAEPKVSSRPLREHLVVAEEPRHEQQNNPEATALGPLESKPLLSPQSVENRHQVQQQEQRYSHPPLRTGEDMNPNAEVKGASQQPPRGHSETTKASRKADPQAPPLDQAESQLTSGRSAQHQQPAKQVQQQDQQCEHQPADASEVQRDERQPQGQNLDASLLLDAIKDYQPMRLSENEAKPVDASVEPVPPASTAAASDAIKEPRAGPWSEWTQKALTGTRLGAHCAPEEKGKHIKAIFQPLWNFFSCIVKRPESANSELTDGDLRRVSAAVKILSHCIASQSLATFRLNTNSYTQFLRKMDAAAKCVERLNLSLAKYVNLASRILTAQIPTVLTKASLLYDHVSFYSDTERDWRRF